MLGLALAPTVSHALAASSPGNPWAEICSVAGGKVVVADAAGATGSQAEAGTHLGHCPLCGQIGSAPALPVAESAASFAIAGADLLPALFAQSPSPLFAWAAARPRAPPASC